MPGTFVLQKASDGQYYFNLRAGNNEIILTSEHYKAKSSAEKSIESVRVNAPLDERYSHKQSSGGKLYFVLLAANGEPLGSSEMYSSKSAVETGIQAVKQEAPSAAVKDLA